MSVINNPVINTTLTLLIGSIFAVLVYQIKEWIKSRKNIIYQKDVDPLIKQIAELEKQAALKKQLIEILSGHIESIENTVKEIQKYYWETKKDHDNLFERVRKLEEG